MQRLNFAQNPSPIRLYLCKFGFYSQGMLGFPGPRGHKGDDGPRGPGGDKGDKGIRGKDIQRGYVM